MIDVENHFKIQITLICLMLSLVFTACAGRETVVEKPADELIADGTRQFEKGNYQKAIEAFEQLKDWYPFSKFASVAELKIADSHFYLNQYADAVFAYEEFEKLHPRNEAVPYVIYQIGMSYYRQVDSVDRDQTPAQNALSAFNRLIRQYPQNSYAYLALGYADKCMQSLAGHEFYVGIYYYRTEHYQAALNRFEGIIKKYSDTGIHSKALSYIQNCETLLEIQKTKTKKDDVLFMPE